MIHNTKNRCIMMIGFSSHVTLRACLLESVMAPTSTASPEVVTPIWTPNVRITIQRYLRNPDSDRTEPTPAVLSVAYVKG
jgi:hypothetical protein